MRVAVALGALVVAACSTGPAEPSAQWEPVAREFAVSARRALADTRFEDLGDEWLTTLLVTLCEDLADGGRPDDVVGRALDDLAEPAGADIDDEILAEVLTAGIAEVCPEDVLVAGGMDPDAAEAFLGAVRPIADQSGLGGSLTDAALLAAGLTACATLDSGAAPDAAGAAVLGSLFGVDAPDLAGLEAAGLGPREGIVAGAVLGAAASTLCSEHAQQVADYVSGVSA
jgi:hypothetical protein